MQCVKYHMLKIQRIEERRYTIDNRRQQAIYTTDNGEYTTYSRQCSRMQDSQYAMHDIRSTIRTQKICNVQYTISSTQYAIDRILQTICMPDATIIMKQIYSKQRYTMQPRVDDIEWTIHKIQYKLRSRQWTIDNIQCKIDNIDNRQ